MSISPKVREASRARDYGKVIELTRTSARMTQTQLGEACGMSQSAISRLEKRGARSYATDVLATMATHLGIPRTLLGLAPLAQTQQEGYEHVERRGFLGGVVAAAVTPALPAVHDHADEASLQAAALRLGTAAYRRLDASVPSRELAEAVRSHVRLVQTVTRSASRDGQRARLAAVCSEAASLVGWLSWDMGDHGSARSWYGSAIKAARAAGNPLLAAYQAGSLAQFEADTGNGVRALHLTMTARRLLDGRTTAVAGAWLASVQALAHAAAGHEREADRALVASRALSEKLSPAEPPPWPWVFAFDESKVAAARVTCGARLSLSGWALGMDVEALATGHAKQRSLVVLDIAAGHLAAGRVEAAFSLATRALETGLQYGSGRIVERARAIRRSYGTTSVPKVVREFDGLLHDFHL
ncbi:helix-turn-helix domain-containing protein [Streptomyces sp. NPDC059247]|uniref:helix-turn-helix domain-containing protein n=1 Tax=Streptomyces sp. NPDC059247 TaxID=3346790 RepID=UPI0036B0F405